MARVGRSVQQGNPAGSHSSQTANSSTKCGFCQACWFHWLPKTSFGHTSNSPARNSRSISASLFLPQRQKTMPAPPPIVPQKYSGANETDNKKTAARVPVRENVRREKGGDRLRELDVRGGVFCHLFESVSHVVEDGTGRLGRGVDEVLHELGRRNPHRPGVVRDHLDDVVGLDVNTAPAQPLDDQLVCDLLLASLRHHKSLPPHLLPQNLLWLRPLETFLETPYTVTKFAFCQVWAHEPKNS